jgi:hypothetical protein
MFLCNSGWAFAAADSLAGAHKIKEGELYQLSAQQLISCANTTYYNEGCDGGSSYMAFMYSDEYPLMQSSDFPFVDALGIQVEDCMYDESLALVSANSFSFVPRNDST